MAPRKFSTNQSTQNKHIIILCWKFIVIGSRQGVSHCHKQICQDNLLTKLIVRELSLEGGRITVHLVSSLTRLNSTASVDTNNDIFSSLVQSNLVKPETSQTVIGPHTVSVLYASLKNGLIAASFSVYFRFFNMSQFRFKLIKANVLCLGFEPKAAGWKAQTNPP